MSSLTGITAIDNTITGLEDLYLDELDVTNVTADTIASTSVSSTTISLNGTDLQTTLTDLQSQITAGGGYFVITCEYAGIPVNQGRFAFGGSVNTTSNLIKTTMPNCSLIACRFELSSSLTTTNKSNIVIEKNGIAISGGSGNFLTGEVLRYLSVANGDFTAQNFTEGDTFNARWNNNGGNTFTGTATGARASFVFQTNAVNGTNGTNGTDGTNGQNVSFFTPNFINLIPATTPYVNDTITTSTIGDVTTQNHQLTFGINRGKNSSFVVGTISSVGTASPSLAIVASTDANGDNVYTMNFGLQQGIQGIQGIQGNNGSNGSDGSKGDKGNQGDKGEKGDMGSIGLPGVPGLAGAVGAMGPMGPRGFDGDKGDKGDQGDPGSYDYIEEDDITQTVSIIGTNGLNISYGGLYCESVANFNNNLTIPSTRQLYISNILPSSSSSTINVTAPTINIGGFATTNLNLESNTITLITHTSGSINFGTVSNSTNFLIYGNQSITNDLTVNNDVNINENLIAGTDGEFNEHIFYGKLYTQTIEGIDNANPLNIGEDTNELQILSNNIAIGNLDNVVSQVIINNKTISIGETLADTQVHIGKTNSKISCNGTTNNITMDTTTFNSNNTTFDVEAQNITLSSDLGSSLITIGSNVNLDTSVYVNTKNINIGTQQTSLTTPKLYMGTSNKTDTRVRGKTIQVLATDKTSIINSTDIDIKSSNNITIDAPAIDIGVDNATVNIQGDLINIGTTGVVNTVNVGNAFSSVNINTIDTEYINVDNFFNQLGF